MASSTEDVYITSASSLDLEQEERRLEELTPSLPPPSSHSSLCRRRREKIYSLGYSSEERRDTRREAAKAFFLSIPLDSELEQKEETDERKESEPPKEPPVPLKLSSITELLSPLATQPISVTANSSGLQFTRDVGSADSPRRSRKNKKIQGSSSFSHVKKLSYGSGAVHQSVKTLRSFSMEPEDRRLGFVYNGYPVVLYSLVPYSKPSRADTVLTGRARTSSISVQLELDGVDLGDPTKEVSLSSLLEPVWRLEPHIDQSKQTALNRSAKKAPVLIHQSSLRDVGDNATTTGVPSRPYAPQSFKENHSSQYVNLNYDPRSLDNPEYFKGRNVTTLNLASYRVSLVKYAREREVKKEINNQFAEIFPYIKLTLSKLRSIKKEMISVGTECGFDPVIIAHSLVYFEKLVLMVRLIRLYHN
ncbi:PREDICTED: CDK5 and ABL1 enzyme substrate 2-like [Amphimedon queenslandica]|uniref:Uncharacterized protein n=2 Tax=Amphimedon queenslandica TaxID=400682 RepID=A0AAN0IRX4_AMPQE|nr:PREDICTED: CDK5 and ABL1 enzyme substrate 2-like [Amphimedon queenslandica]|eukprot:XP_011408239.2 PREDICTED: CDK5 and ABL1 enzyme substrate 2-like [Amphimedon queenslandica]